ncbi:MAG TPA: hypothetical protein VIA06_10020 [Candidatus Dormibacteraeota bacterium]|jgi:hypothetical protein|nr:hypothetical protein [Candidatus Dormibacteraeota bacterium]
MAVTKTSVPGAEELLLALRLDHVQAARLRRMADGGEGALEAIVRLAVRDYLDERERTEHRRRVAQAILTGDAVLDPRDHERGSEPSLPGSPLHSRGGGRRETPLRPIR